MPTIDAVMTPDVRSIRPSDTVQQAAQLMATLNVGALPVCEDGKLLGIITDRDIVLRSSATGAAPASSQVHDIMSREVRTCNTGQDVAQVLAQMGASQIRRVPVLDASSQALVGIVSLGDLALRQPADIGRTLDQISAPAAS